MEKQRLQPGPRPRVKRALPPGDFIALGKSASSKPRSVGESEMRPSQVPINRKPIGSSNIPKRKDINPPVSAKQPRTFSPSFNRGKEVAVSKALDIGEPMPSVKLIDVQAADLEESVLAADRKMEQEQVEGLLCSVMRTLKLNRLKLDPMLYLTLTSLAKSKPSMFASRRVVEHLLQFLRRETTGLAVKPKPNTLLCIMTCNILLHFFQNEDTWPQSFMKVYVEDALGDRAWIDNEYNKDFVNNIVAVFGTVLPNKQFHQIGTSKVLDTSGLLNTSLGKAEEEKILEEVGISLEAEETPGIQNRYPKHKDELAIQTYIHEVTKEQLNKRQMIDSVSRNILRFLTSVCGYIEVRLLASQRIETWLQNPKLTRPAQELLMSVVLNCNTHSAEDIEVIASLVRMRLKSKPVSNQYINCMKELLSRHPDNLGTILKHVIYNELGQQRNPNNMSVLSVIFTNEPETAAKHLALVFQDLLSQREDYLRALRALFREIVRSLKYEVNLVEFCRGMMQERRGIVFLELEQSYKDRMFVSVIDLICLGCLLCVSPVVKELSASLAKGEKRDYSVLQAFQTQVSIIQRDAIWCFHTKVMSMYNCSEKDFVLGLNKVLFLEGNEHYSSKDNWPPESERNLLLPLVRDVPLVEDGLLRLHLLGLADEIPINCADAMDIIERLVLRSAVLKTGFRGLEIERNEVLNMLLSLSAYTHPKDITLPVGYTPPPLAISTLYWKSWLILLVLVATNPSTIGSTVWDTYPTARCMMEMVVTGSYEFPPLGSAELSAEEIRANELQISRAEKEDIVVFEGHLAAATSYAIITESTSLLISQLINLDPSGSPRQPPAVVIDRLKTMNETFGLGKMLCRCREPDFLLLIIQSQGSSRSMPWLADLVQSSESSLNSLPVQCLCEFLLMKHHTSDAELHHSKNKPIKPKVAARLQDLLLGSDATAQSSSELIKYFIQRWSSAEMKDREAAVDGFQSILLLQKKVRQSISDDGMDTDDEMKFHRKHSKMHILKDDTYTWLHEKLPSLPFFDDVIFHVITALRQTLYVEMNIPRLQAYILFLNKYSNKVKEECSTNGGDYFQRLTEDLSHLITVRTTVIQSLVSNNNTQGSRTYQSLLDLFATFIEVGITTLHTDNKPVDSTDQVVITWNQHTLHAGKSMILSLRVLHACAVLLIFGGTQTKSYDFLLQSFFPTVGSYNVQTVGKGKHVQFLEPWLRKMIVQSNINHLVKFGLTGLSFEYLMGYLKMSALSVESLNMLLGLLDECCVPQPNGVLCHAQDQDECIQLIELAQSRGAIGGEKCCALLRKDYQKEDVKFTLNEIATDLLDSSIKDEPMNVVQTHVASTECFNKGSIKEILLAVFHVNKDEDKQAAHCFQKLKQKLSIGNIKKNGDNEMYDLLIDVLNELSDDKTFITKFCSSKIEAISLLKLLSMSSQGQDKRFSSFVQKLNKSTGRHAQLDQAITQLCKRYGIVESSLQQTHEKRITKLLDEVLHRNRRSLDVSDVASNLISKLQECNVDNLSKDKLTQVCKVIAKKSKFLFEQFIQSLCSGFKSQRNVKICAEILVEVINSVEQTLSGLLIDWLSILDPEILNLNPILQREFLFNKREEFSSTVDKKDSSTSYLTSMLAHQTRNSTLQDCFTWLLNSDGDVNSLNASSCLDLVSAMMNNPRLWQGRENKQDNVEEEKQNALGEEDQMELDLSVQQLYRLIQLILSELNQCLKKDKGDEISMSVSRVMDNRLLLLLNLSKRDPKRLQKAVSLSRQVKKFPHAVLLCFLKHLYMRKPTLLPDLVDEIASNEDLYRLPQGNKTEVDDLIHRLLLSIAEPNGTPAWEERFQCVSTINRRLAVRHPFLFLRQLPLVLSLMKGKSRLSSGNFKWTNQLMFCTHVFGLFDLLRPYVFANGQHAKDLMSLFVGVYMELIQSTCLSREACAVVVNTLVEFLNHYISSGNKDAGDVLKRHELIFRDLLYDFPNFQGLTSICTFISTFDSNSDIHPSLLATHISPWNEMQLSSFKRRLSVDHHAEDLLSVICDLDETSRRRIGILEYFTEELSQLTFSSHQDIREKSHLLLIRHYKQKPKNSFQLIDLYVTLLDADNTDVVLTAAKFTPQVVLISDVKCDKILKKMYILSTTNQSPVDVHVINSIKNLNVDYM